MNEANEAFLEIPIDRICRVKPLFESNMVLLKWFLTERITRHESKDSRFRCGGWE